MVNRNGLARYVMSLAATNGRVAAAAELAAAHWRDTPEVARLLKAAVVAGTTTDSSWSGPLAEYRTLAADFIELLRARTIVGRIQDATRRMPFRTRLARVTAGTAFGWAGDGRPAPVSASAFDLVSLDFGHASGIVVLTEELVQHSRPGADAMVQAEMLAGMAQFLDLEFIDPSRAPIGDHVPGSITYGALSTPSTGTTLAAIIADLKTLFALLSNAGSPLTAPFLVMRPKTALHLAALQTTTGAAAFPSIGIRGGSVWGVPVLVSGNVPSSGSPDTAPIVLLDAAEILLADDGDVTFEASRQTSLEMVDAPTQSAATATGSTMVSLWQNSCVGVKADRIIRWAPRRDGLAAAYISDCAF